MATDEQRFSAFVKEIRKQLSLSQEELFSNIEKTISRPFRPATG